MAIGRWEDWSWHHENLRRPDDDTHHRFFVFHSSSPPILGALRNGWACLELLQGSRNKAVHDSSIMIQSFSDHVKRLVNKSSERLYLLLLLLEKATLDNHFSPVLPFWQPLIVDLNQLQFLFCLLLSSKPFRPHNQVKSQRCILQQCSGKVRDSGSSLYLLWTAWVNEVWSTRHQDGAQYTCLTVNYHSKTFPAKAT